MTLAEVIATPYFSAYAAKWSGNSANSPLLSKATQELMSEINSFSSVNQASKVAAMIGAYDPKTGLTAVGKSNRAITAADLYPTTVNFIENSLGVKIGDITKLCGNDLGACAELLVPTN